MNYEQFLDSKRITAQPSGFDVDRNVLNPLLYDFQKDLVGWALRRGKAALFTMTGTGKTAMQVEWSNQVQKHTQGRILGAAPLAVAKQTVREAEKFGIHVHYCRHPVDLCQGINITNYEMLHHFANEPFDGMFGDESGILKSFTGRIRNEIIDFVQNIPFRLFCSATPSPNDFMELGNHAEAVGVMSYNEMLATYFVHDGGETSKWRLKGHAEKPFWEWLSSWACFLNTPSDLGYSDTGFILPPLNTYQHIVESQAAEGALFAFEARGLQERLSARRESIDRRVAKAVEIVNQSPKPFLVWCDLNDESSMLKKAIPGSVEVKGSDPDEHKERSMLEFAKGNIDVMISKPSICGWGMNWQVCCNTAYVGLSDSFESVFQSTKRFHRHGQKNAVNRHFIISEAEGPVLQNIQRKESDFMRMINEMVCHTRNIMHKNIKSMVRERDEYNAVKPIVIPSWIIQGGY